MAGRPPSRAVPSPVANDPSFGPFPWRQARDHAMTREIATEVYLSEARSPGAVGSPETGASRGAPAGVRGVPDAIGLRHTPGPPRPS